MLSKTKSRFISIFVITLIGSAFFAGLRISPGIMNVSTDQYLDNQNYADLTLIPTYGVTDEDIKEIRKIDGVEAVEGIYFFDAQIKDFCSEDINHFDAPVVFEVFTRVFDEKQALDNMINYLRPIEMK